MNINRLFSIFIAITVFSGCNQINQGSTSDVALSTTPIKQVSKPSINNQEDKVDLNKTNAQIKWQQATVKYFNLEGGFYGLITKDGHKYLPMNLDKKLRQDGAIIKIKGELIHDMITIQQWGTPFKILDFELIKAGNNTNAQDL
jgi:hypothetical protein